MWCYRILLRVRWTEKRTNKSILDELQTRLELLAQSIKRKIAFFGHACRINKCNLVKTCILGMMPGKSCTVLELVAIETCHILVRTTSAVLSSIWRARSSYTIITNRANDFLNNCISNINQFSEFEVTDISQMPCHFTLLLQCRIRVQSMHVFVRGVLQKLLEFN